MLIFVHYFSLVFCLFSRFFFLTVGVSPSGSALHLHLCVVRVSILSSTEQWKWPQSDTRNVSQSLCIPVVLSSALWYHLEGMTLKTRFRVWCSGRHSVLWLFDLNSGFALGWLLRSISAHELQCTQAGFCSARQVQMSRAEESGLLSIETQVLFMSVLLQFGRLPVIAGSPVTL